MTQEALRELVASPHWRWMPGMRAIRLSDEMSFVVLHYEDSEEWVSGSPGDPGKDAPIPNGDEWWWCKGAPVHDVIPDLTDPATLGCLLHLVREAWDMPLLTVSPGYVGKGQVEWELDHPYPDALPHPLPKGNTEADALVAALLAAPSKGGELR